MGELESDCDLRLNLDRFAVEQVRFVLPLLHCIRRRFGELSISLQDFDVSDISVFGDCREQFHIALDSHPQSIGRIQRSDLLDEKSCRDSLGHVES